MILGISSFTYGWAVGQAGYAPLRPMTEIELVSLAAKFGLNCLQVGDNLPVHEFSDERLQQFKQDISKHALRIELGARGLTDEHLERYIELCAFMNAPLLRFVIDGNEYEPALARVEAIVKNAISVLSQQQLTLGIENHDRFKATELAGLMENIGSNAVGICLDCVNSLGAGEGLEHVADVLAPYTVNLHIKEFSITRLPHKMGFTVTGAPTGKGMTNVPMLLKLLSNYNRCQSAVLEQWVPLGHSLEETIDLEADWAVESVAYLKEIDEFKPHY